MFVYLKLYKLVQKRSLSWYWCSVNRYSPVCVQSVVHRKRATLNHVAFNPVNPVLVVGDSRGAVHSLKLSPNLRRVTKEAKKAMMNNDLDLVRTLEVLVPLTSACSTCQREKV
jgi:hypothetical protein